MPSPLECRKSQRIKVRFFLTHIKSGLTGEKLSGFTRDLSSGGLMFTSSVEYSLQDTVHLEINLSGWREFNPVINNPDIAGKEDTVVVSVKVLRAQRLDNDLYCIAGSFIWVDNEYQKALEKYVNKQAKGGNAFFS
ncbi:MAG: PilZ domain-containing protein [Candidatus Omnitrophica bacterium]|nr:PilZ domain-containing protein [Candidatus Omnitrophota bacterium]